MEEAQNPTEPSPNRDEVSEQQAAEAAEKPSRERYRLFLNLKTLRFRKVKVDSSCSTADQKDDVAMNEGGENTENDSNKRKEGPVTKTTSAETPSEIRREHPPGSGSGSQTTSAETSTKKKDDSSCSGSKKRKDRHTQTTFEDGNT
ncbi:uncharacterized protein LOC127107853 isoform X2 [Lathyrus oleraceus]|uniref:uncharacterized protein LOC127107853 isoform X2 n=1 Tax=Pisum sativum TaxID=3888 RepID=UPI0021D0BC52|nr:uncharacterized protein LOC127107853 isoform X2 [Pisum sativum]